MIKVVIKVEIHYVRLLGAFECSRFSFEKVVHIFFLLYLYGPFILGRMIKWTFKAFKALGLFAWLSFIHQWMKLLLLPAMAESAFFQPFASFIITSDKGATLPVFTKLSIISKQIRLSSKILEVVSIDALSLIMFVIVRTPFCLKVEYIEIEVLILWKKIMNQSHLDIFH